MKSPASKGTQTGAGWTRRSVFLTLGAVQLVSAAYNLLTKWALDKGGVHPLVFSFYRDVAAAPILAIAALKIEGFQPVPRPGDLLRLALLGLTGLFGNQVLFIMGMQRTTPFIASVVSQTQPIFSATLAAAFGLEAFRWRTLAGVVLAVVGAVVTIGGVDGIESSSGGGLGLLLAGDLSMAVYFIVQKPLLMSGRVEPLTVVAYAYGFGALQLLLMIAVTLDWSDTMLWSTRPETVIALFFAVAMNSCFKYVALSICNRELAVSTVTLFSTLAPVLTASGDWLFFAGAILLRHVMGSVLVLAGLAINDIGVGGVDE